jgi:hypothetical protein
MSENDARYAKQAAELLPCVSGYDLECNSRAVNKCESCKRQPAIAAALKAHWDEAEHYRIEASNVYLANENLQEQLAAAQGEIAALKARIAEQDEQMDRADKHTAEIMVKLEAAEREVEQVQSLHDECFNKLVDVENERDAAYMAGLEAAFIMAKTVDDAPSSDQLCVAFDEFFNDLQALIDAKKGQP